MAVAPSEEMKLRGDEPTAASNAVDEDDDRDEKFVIEEEEVDDDDFDDEEDDDDDEDEDGEDDQEDPAGDAMDCDGEAAANGNAGPSKELQELMALYEEGKDWGDDDEDEDEDWNPAMEIQPKWFCRNCTMSNPEESTHCRLCGEHQRSGILNEGHFADALVAAEDPPSKSSEGKRPRRTAVGFDDRMLLHSEVELKSNPHPERPDRLRSIMAAFQTAGLYPGGCISILPREITRAELEAVHTQEHIDSVEETAKSEFSFFTTDTYANKFSSLAARIAGGICADLSSAILTGRVDNGFALVRPPGHHAEDAKVMGFCLHNNASLAVKAAQAAGAKKVLIVDWDVHHGNGTQEIFERDPSVLYISLHRYEDGKFYPGTGGVAEVGTGPGEGFSVNIPWGCGGIGDNDYILAFIHIVLPIAKQFNPDITIVSAGFDCARGDPLGGCQVTPDGFAQMTKLLTTLCGGKLLVVLEGGYNLRSISESATAVLKVLVGEEVTVRDDVQPSAPGLAALLQVFAVQMRYWPGLVVPPSLLTIASQHSTSNGIDVKASKKRRRRSGGYVYWGLWGRRKRHLFYHLT